jgi:PAS domain-containing protein
MTFFSAVVAAVFIALPIFHKFRCMPARRAAASPGAGTGADIKSSRRSHEGRTFSTHQDPTNDCKTSSMPPQKTGPGEGRSCCTSVAPPCPIALAHLAVCPAGRFGRTASRHGSRRRRGQLREYVPDGLRADALPILDDEQFRGALELLPFAILTTSQHGQIVLANAVSEKLFGYARDELIGASADALVPALADSFHCAQPADIHVRPPPRAVGRARDLVARGRAAAERPRSWQRP